MDSIFQSDFENRLLDWNNLIFLSKKYPLSYRNYIVIYSTTFIFMLTYINKVWEMNDKRTKPSRDGLAKE